MVSKSQNAFVEERQILDVLIANEATDSMLRSNNWGCCVSWKSRRVMIMQIRNCFWFWTKWSLGRSGSIGLDGAFQQVS